MSVANRQRTCAVCGAPFVEGELTELEPLIDGVIRYVAVHVGHTTGAGRRRGRRPATDRSEETVPPAAAA